MFEIEMATLTDPGQRRSNEDALCIGQRGPVCYAVLADGAGGHRGGAIASQMVVEHLQATFEADFAAAQGQLQPDELTSVIEQAHARLQNVQHQAHGTNRMHTTLVALWLHAGTQRALWSHVGDSRLYRLRYGVIDHISRDDSVVQYMVEAGLITADQALVHPARHQLLAALGAEEPVVPHTLPAFADIEDGDAYLLCSDGWWEPLGNERIARLHRDAESPREWLEAMQREIIAANVPHQDNYSAVAVWVNDPEECTITFETLG